MIGILKFNIFQILSPKQACEINQRTLLNRARQVLVILAEFKEKEVQSDGEAARKKAIPGGWRVSRAVSASRRSLAVKFYRFLHRIFLTLHSYLTTPVLFIALSSWLDLVLFPTLRVSNTHTHKRQSHFNHHLKMTVGTEIEEKGTVQVREGGGTGR